MWPDGADAETTACAAKPSCGLRLPQMRVFTLVIQREPRPRFLEGGKGEGGCLILLSWPTKVTAPGVTASLRADKPSDARPDVSRAGRLTSQTIGQSDRKAKHDKKRGALRVNLCETSRAAARRQRSPFAVRASAERRVDSQ